MRTLPVLLFLLLSYCWQPAQAFAIVQTAQTTITTNPQTNTSVKPNRLQQKFQKGSKQQRGSSFLDMSGNMRWLWLGIGFLILSWLASSVISIAATVLGIVALVCLVMWVLKTFNIM